MRKLSRRRFTARALTLPLAMGISRRSLFAATEGSPSSRTSVRPPSPGQSWDYAIRDFYSGSLVDRELDRVVNVGASIDVEVSSDRNDRAPRLEVQDPWGMVRVDPHWEDAQTYHTPLPLWPIQLRPGWKSSQTTRYSTDEASVLAWQQIMKANEWQVITVPAGRFTVLKYRNWINYIRSAKSITNAVRVETLWLAPEVGRWVARESWGYYNDDASGTGRRINEPGFRWELLAWT